MSRSYHIWFAAALAALACGSVSVQAKEATAPSGLQIFAQMQSAMARAATVHVVIRSGKTPTSGNDATKPRQQVAGSLDISLRQHLMHLSVTLTEVSGTTGAVITREHQEFSGVGGTQAQRVNTGAWSCQTVPAADIAHTYSLTSYYPLPDHPTQVQYVGAGTLHGVRTWRVSIPVGLHPITFTVSQRTYRVVRETISFGNQPNQILDYSRYGEAVAVTLPQACKQ